MCYLHIDGIRAHDARGHDNAAGGELLRFENGAYGMALNALNLCMMLSIIILGSFIAIREGIHC